MDDGDFTRSSKPFANLVVCCTGSTIMPEARTEIANHVVEMGAQWKEHLTREVTHMLVGETNTKKYKYVARQRPDVKAVMASFVAAARDIWINGEDLSLEQLEQEHKLPTFFDLKICVTNLQEDDRNKVNQLAEQHGAKFHGDLTKDMTHLIVGVADGKKYKFAQQWRIKCITKEWFYESIERGMALEEEFYDPQLPPDQIGKGAWIRPTLGKRKSVDDGSQTIEQAKPVTDLIRRKIRRTASDRLGSQSQHLWGDIMGQGQATKPLKRDEWDETSVNHDVSVNADASIVSIAFDPLNESASTLRNDDNDGDHGKKNAPLMKQNSVKSGGFFGDTGFYFYGFGREKTNLLQGLIQGHNGECYSSLDTLVLSPMTNLIVVVPEFIHLADVPSASDLSRSIQVVTYWWIEKCMHAMKYVNPDKHALSRPFMKTNIKELNGVTISVSLFEGVDFLHVHKAIDLLGAEWHETLTQKRSLLIVNSPYKDEKSDKITAAKEWDVPIVSVDWLYECIHEGENVPLNKFLVAGSISKTENMKAMPTHDDSKNGEAEKSKAQKLFFTGSTMYIGTSLKQIEAKLKEAITANGGTVVESVNESCTHFLHFQKKGKDNPPDVALASKIKTCKIVSANWVKKCVMQKTLLDEQDHLVTLPKKQVIIDPSRSLTTKHLQLAKSSPVEARLDDSANTNLETQEFAGGPFLLEDTSPAKQRTPKKALYGRHTASDDNIPQILRYESPRKPRLAPDVAEPLIVKPRSLSNASTSTTRSPAVARSRDLITAAPDPATISKALEQIKALRAQAVKDSESGQRKPNPRSRLQGRALSSNSNLSNATNAIISRTTSINTNFEDKDEEEEARKRQNGELPFDMQIMPSQTLVYADDVAHMEKKKLYELLQLEHEDKNMLGRTLSVSTAAVEEMGDPQPTRRRSKRNQ